MPHHEYREEKTCQNCSHYVSAKFCPNCGQENIETRQPFHYLFTHFAEDLTHYDGQFWKTIKYLLFYPGKLTQEYLTGKRKSFVSPVKLYIFISFLTFFLPFILPDFNENKNTEVINIQKEAYKNDNEKLDLLDSNVSLFGLKNIKSVSQLDSIQEKHTKQNQLPHYKYALYKKALQIKEKYSLMSKKDIRVKISETFTHNLPKVIFLYMPLFAFWLWIFHNKKTWFYFDHGIFTFHYFSFLLSIILLVIILEWILSALNIDPPDSIPIIAALYTLFYFFRSHSKIYKETKTISRIKCISLIFLNNFCITLTFIAYIIFVILII